ncbi:MAG TPA: type III-B CRISPR module RAMP protein Cmr4 [Mycobacteriales bacterium]|nr:type III-B CRISPR module RAMP protein Cmr4 [Mycobacteriales bacterium]
MGERGLLFFYAETPVHPGGSESVGVLDLPIQRESTTRLPTMWGQSAKGALRDHAGEQDWSDVTAVFGSAPPGSAGAGDGPPSPGWLAVGDLRLVAFPVPTLRDTFAWVTSPLALARQARAAQVARVPESTPPVPTVADDHVVFGDNGWSDGPDAKVGVGEYALTADPVSTEVLAWARWLSDNALPTPPADGRDPFAFFRKKLATDLLVVSDAQFTALTEEHAEVTARVQLHGDEKTVRHGPWYTEYLPAETLLCSMLRNCAPHGDVDSLGARLDGDVLVAGGDETIGKGLVRTQLLPAGGGA